VDWGDVVSGRTIGIGAATGARDSEASSDSRKRPGIGISRVQLCKKQLSVHTGDEICERAESRLDL